MADDNIDSFLAGLQGRLVSTAVQSSRQVSVQKADDGFIHATTPAPNAIEWAIGADWLNVQSIYRHVRQYQVIRDLFQLRCPLPSCNGQAPLDKDCWGKGREYLESESLLRFSTQYGEDVCPKCGTTRSEFVEDGLLNLYNQMHMVAGMRCLPLNTRVLTSNGFKTFGELLPGERESDKFYPIGSLNVHGQLGWEPASDVYYAGSLPSKTIVLKNGVTHKGSIIHPVYGFVNGSWGWHKLQDVSPGDVVQTHLQDKWVDGDSDVTNEEAGLLGYLVSEGSVNNRYVFKFSNGDAETVDHFGHLCKVAFNYSPPVYEYGEKKYSVEACNASMRNRLRSLGLHKSIASTKVVPESIFRAKKSAVSAYLRAYFEGDGTAAVEKKTGDNNRVRKPAVACYTVSHQLALDTQQLLLALGIESSIVASKSRRFGTGGTKFGHNAYSIRIYGRNIIKFSEEVGFNSARKSMALAECVSTVKSSDYNNVHSIPCVRDIILRLKNKYKLSASACQPFYGVMSGRYKTASASSVSNLVSYLDGIGFGGDADVLLLGQLCAPTNRFVEVKEAYDSGMCEMADLHVPGTHSFVANGVMNHNSGKTATAAIIGTYVEHRVITIGHATQGGLARYYDQLPGQQFDITFIASTDVQSKDTIWAKYAELRKTSPWFAKYVRWIKSYEIKQQTPNGMKPWAYEELDKEIRNGCLNLIIKSMNSNSGGMAGRTRLAAFIDELARFDVTDSSRGADEVYRVLDNSLATVRAPASRDKSAPWLGLMSSISSPISIEDKSMTLLRQCPSIRNMYYGHYATWDFNPDLPRETFDSAFERDPIGAMRDYGAQPPSAASPLITDPLLFRKLTIQPDLKPTATFRNIVHVDRTGREYLSITADAIKLSRDGERYICFDAGASFDQFAGACAHGEWVQTPEGRQLVTVYDWVLRVLPETKPRRDVWFDFVVQLMEAMSKSYVIARVDFDRWQSTHLIQQIRDRGVRCEMQGTTYEHFVKFMNDANFSRIRMLPPNPDDHNVDPPAMSAQGLAFYEIERLERSPDLKRIYNPRKGQRRGWNSDDVATVVAHVNNMVQSTVIDISNSNGKEHRLRRESMGGTTWSGRGTLFRPIAGTKRGW